MYLKAVIRPFSSIRRLLWGAFLLMWPVVNILFFGYLYECARSAYSGSTGLPKWENYGRLFLNGLKMFLISLIYTIPVYLLLAVASTFYLAIDDLLGIPIYAVCIIIIYLLPLALLKFMILGRFGSAFKGLLKRAFTWLYLKTILKLVLLFIPYFLFNLTVALILFSLLSSIDWILYFASLFVVSFVSAAFQITGFTILAKSYRKL